MPYNQDKPLGRRGTNTRAAKKKRVERVQGRVKRGARIKKILDFARQSDAENRYQAWKLVCAEIDEELLPGPKPHYATFYRWLNEAEDWRDERSLHQVLDKPRSGRPRIPFHPDVLEFMEEEILQAYHPSVRSLYEATKEFAEAKGLEAPSEYRVKRFYDETPRVVLVAARYGSRAAVADALPKSSSEGVARSRSSSPRSDESKQSLRWALRQLTGSPHPQFEKASSTILLLEVRPKRLGRESGRLRMSSAARLHEPSSGGGYSLRTQIPGSMS